MSIRCLFLSNCSSYFRLNSSKRALAEAILAAFAIAAGSCPSYTMLSSRLMVREMCGVFPFSTLRTV